LSGAAAAEGQGALNALDIYCSSFGFDRDRSRWAKIINGSKKAAYYPNTRYSPQALAKRLASPFFLPVTLPYHEVLTVAQLDKAEAACTEAYAACPDEGFCHAAQRFSLPRLTTPPHPSISFCAGKQRLKMKADRKRKKGGGKGGGASRSSPARVQRAQSGTYTQSSGLYCRPSLLGV
jgi:hypothetical protein